MRQSVLVLLLALVPFLRGQAQEVPFYQEHPHSVEISTGPPFLLAMIYPPGSMDNGLTMNGWHTGLGYKSWFPVNVSLGYNYQYNRHWEFSFQFTYAAYVYSTYQYPEKGENEFGKVYDWNATPQNLGLGLDSRVLAPASVVRYYWLTKKPKFQLYSALGVGVFLGYTGSLRVCPTLTPFGIRFGSRHWFGRAELTIGPAATLIQIGVGRRF